MPAYKTSNYLRKALMQKQVVTNNVTNSGVYKITCSECPTFLYRMNEMKTFARDIPKTTTVEQKSNFSKHFNRSETHIRKYSGKSKHLT